MTALEPEYYPLNDEGEFQGTCLVISNETFIRNSSRRGTQLDVSHLKTTFTGLHFDFVYRENRTAAEITACVKEMSARDHSRASMFVCCVLSHGHQGVVLGVDDKGVDIEDLVNVMEACVSLKEKPKLFFIQACQDLTRFVASDGSSPTAASPADIVEKWTNKRLEITLPEGSDTFLGISTIPGKMSFRTGDGTWFIVHLCDKIDKYADSLPLLSIYTKVQHAVSKEWALFRDSIAKQIPDIKRSTLRFPCFLRPPQTDASLVVAPDSDSSDSSGRIEVKIANVLIKAEEDVAKTVPKVVNAVKSVPFDKIAKAFRF